MLWHSPSELHQPILSHFLRMPLFLAVFVKSKKIVLHSIWLSDFFHPKVLKKIFFSFFHLAPVKQVKIFPEKKRQTEDTYLLLLAYEDI